MSSDASRSPARKLLIWAAVVAAVALVAGANAHLVYVALESEPGCVAHAKMPSAGAYSAAKPAC